MWHCLNELLDSENDTRYKKIYMGTNFRKDVRSLDGYILGTVNSQKLKFSRFSFHKTEIRITKFQGNLRGSPWKLLKNYVIWRGMIHSFFFFFVIIMLLVLLWVGYYPNNINFKLLIIKHLYGCYNDMFTINGFIQLSFVLAYSLKMVIGKWNRNISIFLQYID